MTLCPCCNREMEGPVGSKWLADAPMSPQLRIIVRTLAAAYPRPVETSYLIEALYADDPNGGPDNPEGVVRTLVSRLRALLPNYGWNIPINRAGHGNFGRYRLKPVEVKR